ncbi:hypothetical protein MSG28_012695 [Choristoneura fumiferana]|uniref:Uncharacterized protein n=1 Tax=Choristoneura fumiferana TaxID=7141 RepID=A0ACC0JHL7_CHOFU|nr:hypothetical protein MSG28_012695 [Choristoneura fumiferana]
MYLHNTVDPWCCAPVRAACLVELKRSAELFAFAHTLVDSYPHSWTAWFAVGCYYYLIGKNELARRYLGKAKSLEPGAGCVWLAQGHSFAADNEHDQAMAAYFKVVRPCARSARIATTILLANPAVKQQCLHCCVSAWRASQLMAGSHLPPLYVGVECALLNNFTMCERFLLRAATLHSSAEKPVEVSYAGAKASPHGPQSTLSGRSPTSCEERRPDRPPSTPGSATRRSPFCGIHFARGFARVEFGYRALFPGNCAFLRD